MVVVPTKRKSWCTFTHRTYLADTKAFSLPWIHDPSQQKRTRSARDMGEQQVRHKTCITPNTPNTSLWNLTEPLKAHLCTLYLCWTGRAFWWSLPEGLRSLSQDWSLFEKEQGDLFSLFWFFVGFWTQMGDPPSYDRKKKQTALKLPTAGWTRVIFAVALEGRSRHHSEGELLNS